MEMFDFFGLVAITFATVLVPTICWLAISISRLVEYQKEFLSVQKERYHFECSKLAREDFRAEMIGRGASVEASTKAAIEHCPLYRMRVNPWNLNL